MSKHDLGVLETPEVPLMEILVGIRTQRESIFVNGKSVWLGNVDEYIRTKIVESHGFNFLGNRRRPQESTQTDTLKLGTEDYPDWIQVFTCEACGTVSIKALQFGGLSQVRAAGLLDNVWIKHHSCCEFDIRSRLRREARAKERAESTKATHESDHVNTQSVLSLPEVAM